MAFRRGVSAFLLVAVFFAYSAVDLRAAGHTVSSKELSQAVQNSSQQIAAERKSVNDFFARPEVQAQIKKMGIEKLNTALLSDSEIQQLNKQIMSSDLQSQTSGLSKGAIWAIVLGGVALIAIITWLEVRAIDDALNSY
jgi:hypothetical protein